MSTSFDEYKHHKRLNMCRLLLLVIRCSCIVQNTGWMTWRNRDQTTSCGTYRTTCSAWLKTITHSQPVTVR